MIYKKRLLQEWEELPKIFATSSSTKVGKEELLSYINYINKELI